MKLREIPQKKKRKLIKFIDLNDEGLTPNKRKMDCEGNHDDSNSSSEHEFQYADFDPTPDQVKTLEAMALQDPTAEDEDLKAKSENETDQCVGEGTKSQPLHALASETKATESSAMVLHSNEFQSYQGEPLALSVAERPELPVSIVANHFAKVFSDIETIILIGETGCGKSTQVPQLIYEIFNNCKMLSRHKLIGITEPRRIAATSLATRVQDELNSSRMKFALKIDPRGVVGHRVRFSDTTTERSKIVFLTEATLLKTCYEDAWFSEYDVIIVDEAHERSVSLDMLLGALKEAQKQRQNIAFYCPTLGRLAIQPLKIVIMTATGDAGKFKDYFPSSEVVLVSGKTYPVNLKYLRTPIDDYYSATVAYTIELHDILPVSEHMLVFLTGQDEIEGVIKAIDSIITEKKYFLCPLYAALPASAQAKAFEIPPSDTRKIVIATNIAETSLTIPGIKVVIDSGYAKSSYHIGKIGIETFRIDKISKSEANQRAGRAGREDNGNVYRLYTQSQYENMEDFNTPAIVRSDLSSMFMMIPSLHFGHWKKSVLSFPFFERPSETVIRETFSSLKALGLIDGSSFNDMTYTDNGNRLASIPLVPQLAKVLLESNKYGIMPEICQVISMIEAEHIYLPVPDDKKRAALKKLIAPEGDLITFYNIMKEYIPCKSKKQWCDSHALNLRSLVYANQVRKQLIEIIKDMKFKEKYPNRNPDVIKATIIKIFAENMPWNVAKLNKLGKHYEIQDGDGRLPLKAKIHRSSLLAAFRPPSVLFTKLTFNQNQDLFMHNCVVLTDPVTSSSGVSIESSSGSIEKGKSGR